MVPKPNTGAMYAVNKTTVLRAEDVADEELKRKVEEDPMATFEPHENDVLCGRGGSINNHAGNENYRILVNQKKRVYLTARFKREKRLIAASIVQSVRGLEPPGRFLQRDPHTGVWQDIGDTKARDKTSQALREGAPEIRKEIENDRKLMMNNEEEEDEYDEGETDEIKNMNGTPHAMYKSSRDGNGAHDYMVPPPNNPSHPHQTVHHDPRAYPPSHRHVNGAVPFSAWPINRSSSRDSSQSKSTGRGTPVISQRGAAIPSHPNNSSPYANGPMMDNSPSNMNPYPPQRTPGMERRHNANMQYGHNHPYDRSPPMDEFRQPNYNPHLDVRPTTVVSARSWSEGGPENYTSRAQYSRYQTERMRNPKFNAIRQNDQRMNHRSLTKRDRPDSSPIRSTASPNTPAGYFETPQYDGSPNTARNYVQPTKGQHKFYVDDRQALAPTPIHSDDRFQNMNSRENLKQPSTWNNREVQQEYPTDQPNMRLPSWDSDFANMENESGDMNVFDHDVVMGDAPSAHAQAPNPSHSQTQMHPSNRPYMAHNEHQIVQSNNYDRQLVESRVEKEDWSARAGCNALQNIISENWSNMFFRSNSFEHEKFCGVDLCNFDRCNYVIEDDPSKAINNFGNVGSPRSASNNGLRPSAPRSQQQSLNESSQSFRNEPANAMNQGHARYESGESNYNQYRPNETSFRSDVPPVNDYTNDGQFRNEAPNTENHYYKPTQYRENNVKAVPSWGKNEARAAHFEKNYQDIKPMQSWGSAGSQECKLSVVSGLSQIGSDMMEPLPIDAADFEVSPNIFNPDSASMPGNNRNTANSGVPRQPNFMFN